MDLYGQEPEVRLLATLLTKLGERSVIDVGAEQGAFTQAMLEAGSDTVFAVEPEPENVRALKERFRDQPAVTVLDYALTSADAPLELHHSVAPGGEPITFGHTLLDRPGSDEIAWEGSTPVVGRSLASLVEAHEVPRRVGILKIDTEGNDFAVVEGMGELDCDVVMVEHWLDLPKSLGPCPWTTQQVSSALEARGFSHFAFIAHRGDFVILKWDDGSIPSGQMGNLVFLHDRVLARLLPSIVELASTLAETAVETGERYANAARERVVMINELERERATQAAAASERLRIIDQLTRRRSRFGFRRQGLG